MATSKKNNSNKNKALRQIDIANKGERKTWVGFRHQVVTPKKGKGKKYNRSERKRNDREYY